uniref:arylesterase n=1 Tax=Acanthochromis polyacanthus TaxID=80966 RepID=A0A3Q1F5V4_9TELE
AFGLKFPGVPSSDEPGKIFVLDLNDSRMKPVELRMPRNFDLETFNPHGISLYTDPSGKTPDNLMRGCTPVTHKSLVNDILAVGVDSFYATNDHYFENQFLQSYVEILLFQPWGNVVPTEVKEVSQGYYFANGINMSPDKRHIYVADLFDHNVHVLERKEDNTLTRVKTVAVGSLVDNIEVDPETGDLWVGCHPNGWKALLFDPNDPAGSEVVRIQNIHSDKPQVTRVYEDDGQVLIGSSVATTYGGKLLIGTIFHKTLVCDLK